MDRYSVLRGSFFVGAHSITASSNRNDSGIKSSQSALQEHSTAGMGYVIKDSGIVSSAIKRAVCTKRSPTE